VVVSGGALGTWAGGMASTAGVKADAGRGVAGARASLSSRAAHIQAHTLSFNSFTCRYTSAHAHRYGPCRLK